jgi:hypothetical protein
MHQPAEFVREGDVKILERLRTDLRLGRHHPRGTASADLIRRWGFQRVMKHIDTIRMIFDRVEAEEQARARVIDQGVTRAAMLETGAPPMRRRSSFPGDLRATGRGTGSAPSRIPPEPASLFRRRLPG